MSSTVAEIAIPVEETEAYETLLGRVGKRTGKIPPEVLVRHVLAIVPAAEWPVRVEAMDALLRRLESATTRRAADRVAAAGRAAARARTRPGGRARAPGPIAPSSLGVDPIEARCDCPDFLKNSLGVCKHILDRARAPPRPAPAPAAGAQGAGVGRAAGPAGPALGPDPAADRARRLAGARRLARRRPRRSRRARPRGAGAAVVPARRRTAPLVAQERLSPTTRRGGWRWSRTCSRSSRPAPRASATTRRCAPCCSRERDRLKRIVEQALAPAELRAALKGLKRPLYPYQREGVERFLADGPAAPGRRHGAGQDGAGDRLAATSSGAPAGSAAA